MAVAVAWILAGCATPQPKKTFVRRSSDFEATMPTVDRIGVYVDGAVAYDRSSGQFFDIEDSRTAIANICLQAQVDLKSKGYEVPFIEAPFVGGFKKPAELFPVASDRHTAPIKQNAPFYTATDVSADLPYRDELLAISRQVLAATASRGNLPTEVLQADQQGMDRLKDFAVRKNIRYLLVVLGNGVIVSGGKQFAQILETSLVTSLATGGLASESEHNISFLDNYISLIDLQNCVVLWSNSLRLHPFDSGDPRSYGDWGEKILHFLPARGRLEPSPAPSK